MAYIRSLARLTLALALAAAPALSSSTHSPERGAPTLFHGGRIHLNDGKGTVVDAILVRDGRVAAFGSAAVLLAEAEDSDRWTRVDLEGATAVPGLQDGHASLERSVQVSGTVDLRGAADQDEWITRLLPIAAETPEGEWIIGHGFHAFGWADAEVLDHTALSAAFPEHPVVLFDADGLTALANAAAMKLAGVDGSSVAGVRARGGRMPVDDEGEPTGVFLDGATSLISTHLPRIKAEESMRRFLAVQERLLAAGITAVHEMGASLAFVRLLEEARQQGRLRLRVVVYLSSAERLDAEVLATLPLQPDPADRLCVRGVRLVVDGRLSSRGAALIGDYADAPGQHGRLLLSEDDLARSVMRVARAGLQPVVLATGDRANRMAVDVLEGLSNAVPELRAQRARVEGAQVVATKDWPRFPAVGLIPSLQPARNLVERDVLEARLGVNRSTGVLAWRELAPELGRLTFGSGYPAGPLDPIAGLCAARGVDSSHGLGAAEVLLGFTAGAAWAAHQEDRRGRLQPGYWADLTVFSVDPVEEPIDVLAEAHVRMTVVNGVILFRDAGR